MCDIHTVLHREAATWEGQRRRRPEALPLGRPLISETTRGGGPAGPQSHLHFPFPAHRAQFRHHSRGPSPQRGIFLRVRSKFIGLSQLSGPPGFVVRPSRPPRQGRDSEESLHYNPHDAPRAARSQCSPLPRTAARARGPAPREVVASPAAAVNVATPPLALLRTPSDSLPRRRRFCLMSPAAAASRRPGQRVDAFSVLRGLLWRQRNEHLSVGAPDPPRRPCPWIK
nr:uncharacterized protein LOC108385505 [Manis javanica]